MRLYAIENYCPDIKHGPKSRQSNCVADKVHYKKGATIWQRPSLVIRINTALTFHNTIDFRYTVFSR